MDAISDTPFYGTLRIDLIDLARGIPFDVLHDVRYSMFGIQTCQQMDVIRNATQSDHLHRSLSTVTSNLIVYGLLQRIEKDWFSIPGRPREMII